MIISTPTNAANATLSRMGRLGRWALFVDVALLILSSVGLWLAGTASAGGALFDIWALVCGALIIGVSCFMIPEDYERWIRS